MLAIDRRWVARVLWSVIAVLSFLHFVIVPARLSGWSYVDLDAESGVGTWFASFQLATAAALVAGLALLRARQGLSWRALAGLGLVLLVFSIEEVAAFHERLSSAVGGAVGTDDSTMGGTPIIGLVLLPFAVIGMRAVSKSISPRCRAGIVAGAAIFGIATFGIEQLESWNAQGELPLMRTMALTTSDSILVGIQELGEMIGVAVILLVVLREWEVLGQALAIRVMRNDERVQAVPDP